MDNLFITQLVVSFIVGGAFIAFLSFLAERASERTAGIIISLPATIALGFFFIGWALGPQKIAEVAPVVPAVEGVIMLFTITYLYLSKIKLPKLKSIILCVVGGLSVWFIFAIPLAIIKLSNLYISLLIYAVLTGIGYYYLTIKPKVKSTHSPLKYSISQKIGRGLFAGSVITFAVFLSKTLGPFWGALFSAFPAVFLSTLIIVHFHYNSAFLFKVWKNSPIGSILFTIYPVTAIYTFPAFGIWGGTLVSYLISLLGFFILVKVKIIRDS